VEPIPSILNPVEKSGTECARVAPARILIGPLASDPTESVSGVNRAFIQGLSDRYTFIPLRADRTRGNTRQSRLNVFNLFYFVRQLCQWSMHLVRRRPHIAHYAISAGWAMEKGLMFMRLARLCKVKTLAHLHSGGFPDYWRSLPVWRRKNAARQFERLDGLVLASEWWRQEIARYLPLPPGKLFVVNNPIDAEFEKAALAMPPERPGNVILAMGVMGRAKGIFDILAAATIVAATAKSTFKLAGAEREPNILRDAREYAAQNGLAQIVEINATVGRSRRRRIGHCHDAGGGHSGVFSGWRFRAIRATRQLRPDRGRAPNASGATIRTPAPRGSRPQSLLHSSGSLQNHGFPGFGL
jgi:glycosyltransferase involved in cell wall biosynthesis